MTLWVDDGTEDGFLASCANCPYALDLAERVGHETPVGDLVCTYEPPQPVVYAAGMLRTYPDGGVSWLVPAVESDWHCHNHPIVRWHGDNRPIAIRRYEPPAS